MILSCWGEIKSVSALKQAILGRSLGGSFYSLPLLSTATYYDGSYSKEEITAKGKGNLF